jgi:hypothetical protein
MTLYQIDLYRVKNYDGGYIVKRIPDYGYIQIPSARHSSDFLSVVDIDDNPIGMILRNRIIIDPSLANKKGLYAVVTRKITPYGSELLSSGDINLFNLSSNSSTDSDCESNFY